MWFKELVGFREESPQQVRENLSVSDGVLHSKVNGRSFRCGILETPSLAELRQRTASLGLGTSEAGLSVAEEVGDVQVLHQAQGRAGAIFQVASQFNLLEMVGPSVTPEQGVEIYEGDRTQGPACAIACGAGTIQRNYFVRMRDGQIGQSSTQQIDCLRDLGDELGNQRGALWEMRNGYALASLRGLEHIRAQIEGGPESWRDSLRGKLRVGLQQDTEVTLGDSGHCVSQVYCSALPVAYSQLPACDWEPFARLILEAAYEATLLLALLNRARTGSREVYLTLLGGGAFGNRAEWISDSILRALRLFANQDLIVRIVSYGHSDQRVRDLVASFSAGDEADGNEPYYRTSLFE